MTEKILDINGQLINVAKPVKEDLVSETTHDGKVISRETRTTLDDGSIIHIIKTNLQGFD